MTRLLKADQADRMPVAIAFDAELAASCDSQEEVLHDPQCVLRQHHDRAGAMSRLLKRTVLGFVQEGHDGRRQLGVRADRHLPNEANRRG